MQHTGMRLSNQQTDPIVAHSVLNADTLAPLLVQRLTAISKILPMTHFISLIGCSVLENR